MALHFQILLGLLAGVGFGWLWPEASPHVSWLGDLFLRALTLLIIPLVLTSIASAIVGVGESKSLGRLGAKTLVYYFSSSAIAAGIGLTLVNVFRPGAGLSQPLAGAPATSQLPVTEPLSLFDNLLDIVPTNMFAALAEGNLLSVIFVAVALGVGTINLPAEDRARIGDLLRTGFELMMTLTLFVLKLAPLGVFGLLAGVVGTLALESGGVGVVQTVTQVGWFLCVVLLGLALHAGVVLPTVLKLSGVSPWNHVRNMTTPLLTAFSTASSSATLPLTMEALETKSGLPPRVTSFVLPLGATINMDGTALYECVSALFIAQVYGIHLSVLEQITVVVTALGVSVGAAGIPMAGLIMMSVVLTAVGLPLEGMGLVLTVESLLGRLRTAVNIWGDSCGAALIARSEGFRPASPRLRGQ